MECLTQGIWEKTASGKESTVTFRQEEGEAKFFLSEQKKDICFIRNVTFGQQMPQQLKEDIWLLFCQEAQQKGIRFLLACRAAQSWFAKHPKETQLLTAKVKTKLGF